MTPAARLIALATALVFLLAGPALAAPTLNPDKPPSISGTPNDGETLTANDGEWTGAGTVTTTRQWQRCFMVGCSDIDGQTGETYVLGPEDVHATIQIVVTATDAGDSATERATSAAVGPVVPDPVVNTDPPSISDPSSPTDGERLVAFDPGTWTGTGIESASVAYQWERCRPTCTPIPGATGSEYRLSAGDVGGTVRVMVTRSTTFGTSGSAASNEVGPVAAIPLRNRGAPWITGPARVGRSLNANDGVWDGSGVSVSRNWLRCGPGGCSDTGATGPTYAVTAADAGSTIVLRVHATGLAGNATVDSAPTAVVTANAPPTASFTYFPRTVTTADTLALTATSNDPDGAIVSQTWDLDDDGRFDDASGVEVLVRFGGAGRRDVSLRVVDSEGAVDTVTRTIRVGRPDRLISPFPVVRIVGGGTLRGARIRTLVVRAPRGAKVTVRCKGRCPARRQAKAIKSGSARFRRFERALVAGTVLEVRVTQPDRIGKFTRFKIRRGKAPLRTDRCLMPGSTRPTACPGD